MSGWVRVKFLGRVFIFFYLIVLGVSLKIRFMGIIREIGEEKY